MLDREALQTVLLFRCSRHEKPVIVTGRKPACWKCRASVHLSSSGPEKKLQTKDLLLFFSSLSWACQQLGQEWSNSQLGPVYDTTFPEKPLTAACAFVEKENGEWLVAERVRGKRQTVGFQSPEAPGTNGTYSPTPSTSVKGDPRLECIVYRDPEELLC